MTIASGRLFRQILDGSRKFLCKSQSTTAVRKAVLRKGPMERRLAAIVCADIAGYARLMGADEAGTHASFKAHRSAIYPIILNHGGRLVKNTGDGFLLEFASIVGAIEAAIAMQTVMAERNHHLPADRVMHFRMGVHMGVRR
jgi:adenylate cyclase